MENYELTGRQATFVIMAIELIVAASLVVMGVYLGGPWYVVMPGSTAFGQVAEISHIATYAVGWFYTAAGITWALGIWINKKRVRTIGRWMALSAYTMQVAARITIQGLVPLVWMYQLAILLIITSLIVMEKVK